MYGFHKNIKQHNNFQLYYCCLILYFTALLVLLYYAALVKIREFFRKSKRLNTHHKTNNKNIYSYIAGEEGAVLMSV